MKILKQIVIIGLISLPYQLVCFDRSSIEEKENAHDSILNLTDNDITIKVQYGKRIPYSDDRKKNASLPRIVRAATYVIAPKQELKMNERFFKANALDDKSDWYGPEIEINAQDLTMRFDSTMQMGDSYIKSKKYIVSRIDDELQVEIKKEMK